MSSCEHVCHQFLWNKAFPLVPFLVSYFHADVGLNQIPCINWVCLWIGEQKKSDSLQDAHLYLLLRVVKHQKAYNLKYNKLSTYFCDCWSKHIVSSTLWIKAVWTQFSFIHHWKVISVLIHLIELWVCRWRVQAKFLVSLSIQERGRHVKRINQIIDWMTCSLETPISLY